MFCTIFCQPLKIANDPLQSCTSELVNSRQDLSCCWTSNLVFNVLKLEADRMPILRATSASDCHTFLASSIFNPSLKCEDSHQYIKERKRICISWCIVEIIKPRVNERKRRKTGLQRQIQAPNFFMTGRVLNFCDTYVAQLYQSC